MDTPTLQESGKCVLKESGIVKQCDFVSTYAYSDHIEVTVDRTLAYFLRVREQHGCSAAESVERRHVYVEFVSDQLTEREHDCIR